jgi:NADPH:quinone reductase-like Zn-dependent oxidoreductase
MKAFIYDYSLPSKMRMVTDRPKPGAPSSHQVTVQVVAIGLNLGDWKIPGHFLMKLGRDKSLVGMDFSGRVVAAGSAVCHVKVGDAVSGFNWGCFAETINVNAKVVCKVPDNCNLEEAASWYCCGITALQALKSGVCINPTTAKKILVIGASGGIGHFAVQMARALTPPESQIIAVCSAKNAELVIGWGADQVIDYNKPGLDITKEVSGCDLVLDCISPIIPYEATATKCLSKTGKYIVFDSKQIGSFLRQVCAMTCGCCANKRFELVFGTPNIPDGQLMAELFGSGKVKAHISSRLPFEEKQLTDAIKVLKTNRQPGKIIATF